MQAHTVSYTQRLCADCVQRVCLKGSGNLRPAALAVRMKSRAQALGAFPHNWIIPVWEGCAFPVCMQAGGCEVWVSSDGLPLSCCDERGTIFFQNEVPL